jgi:catechol 2,3-dioxygenase-like lactoylglutathione lyase family enzyme
MPIQCLQIVSVPVSDQDRARRFYVDGLGWDLLSDEVYEMGGVQHRWLEVRPPGGQTALTLVQADDPSTAGSMDGLILRANDLEGTVDDLARRGVPIGREITETPRARFVTFEDPDGNAWMIQEQRAATRSAGA